MEKKTVYIPAISCGHCVRTIVNELGDIDGVVSVGGDAESRTVTVSWESPATWKHITAVLDDIGYPPEV